VVCPSTCFQGTDNREGTVSPTWDADRYPCQRLSVCLAFCPHSPVAALPSARACVLAHALLWGLVTRICVGPGHMEHSSHFASCWRIVVGPGHMELSSHFASCWHMPTALSSAHAHACKHVSKHPILRRICQRTSQPRVSLCRASPVALPWLPRDLPVTAP